MKEINMNTKGMLHHKRQKLSCVNGHRYTTANTKIIKEKRFSKKLGITVEYTTRQCRRCLNVTKKFYMRKWRERHACRIHNTVSPVS